MRDILVLVVGELYLWRKFHDRNIVELSPNLASFFHQSVDVQKTEGPRIATMPTTTIKACRVHDGRRCLKAKGRGVYKEISP